MIDIETILTEARDLIERAANPHTDEITNERLKNVYNSDCNSQLRLTPSEYELASLIAAGAVADQEGGNIVKQAAQQNITSLLWELQEMMEVGEHLIEG